MVKGFDNFTIILESEGKQMMVYKHAVSTISPGRRLNTSFSEPKTSPNVSAPEGGH
jgi:host factor-I protein